MAAPRLIALYSPVMRSGKSTVAEMLNQHHGFHRVSFAAPVKEMVRTLLLEAGLSPMTASRCVYGDLKETPCSAVGGHTPRFLLQTLGTDWREIVDTRLWSNLALARAQAHRHVVIDDMRFAHEFEAVKAAGGDCWIVTRDGVERTNDHPSEGLLDNYRFDVGVENNSDLNTLAWHIDQIMEHHYA